MSFEPHEIQCVDCGKTIMKNKPWHCRCKECAQKRDRETARERQRKQRGQAIKTKPKPKRKVANAKDCKGCKYFDSSLPCCDYYLVTGVKRGCGAGRDCTKKEVGKKERI